MRTERDKSKMYSQFMMHGQKNIRKCMLVFVESTRYSC